MLFSGALSRVQLEYVSHTDTHQWPFYNMGKYGNCSRSAVTRGEWWVILCCWMWGHTLLPAPVRIWLNMTITVTSYANMRQTSSLLSTLHFTSLSHFPTGPAFLTWRLVCLFWELWQKRTWVQLFGIQVSHYCKCEHCQRRMSHVVVYKWYH